MNEFCCTSYVGLPAGTAGTRGRTKAGCEEGTKAAVDG